MGHGAKRGLSMAFIFEYNEVRYGEGDFCGPEDMVIRGKLISGSISLMDEISLTSSSDKPFSGSVSRFTESFDDWLGLPFYEVLSDDDVEDDFCIVVQGRPLSGVILSGVATGVELKGND